MDNQWVVRRPSKYHSSWNVVWAGRRAGGWTHGRSTLGRASTSYAVCDGMAMVVRLAGWLLVITSPWSCMANYVRSSCPAVAACLINCTNQSITLLLQYVCGRACVYNSITGLRFCIICHVNFNSIKIKAWCTTWLGMIGHCHSRVCKWYHGLEFLFYTWKIRP